MALDRPRAQWTNCSSGVRKESKSAFLMAFRVVRSTRAPPTESEVQALGQWFEDLTPFPIHSPEIRSDISTPCRIADSTAR